MNDLLGPIDAAPPWLLTFAIHSALLAAIAWTVTRSRTVAPAERSLAARCALFGAFVTASFAGVVGPDVSFGLASGPSTPARSSIEARAAGVATSIQAEELASGGDVESSSAEVATPTVSLEWGRLAAIGTVSLALVALARLARCVHRRRRWLRDIGPRTALDVDVPACLREWNGARRRSARVRLTCSASISSPTALSSREVCVPTSCWNALKPSSREALIAHELAHVERRDPLWFAATSALESVAFFLPWIRVVARWSLRAAESDCDERAARRVGDRGAVARCLLEVSEWGVARRAAPGFAAMGASGPAVVERVRLLTGRAPSAPKAWRGLAAGAALAIVACAGPNVATTESDDDGASAARSEAHEIVLHVGTDESIRGVHQGSPDLLCQFRERQGREQLREWAATVVQGLPTRALSTGLGAAAGLEIRDGRAVIVTERETPFRTVQHLMEAMASPNVQLPDIVLRVDGREHPIPLPTVEFDAEPRDTVDVLVQKSKDGTTTFEMRTAKTVLLGPPRPETNAETPEEEAVAEVEPPRTDMRTDLSAWAATVDSFDATVDARRGTTVGDAIDAMDALRDAGVDRIVWIGSYER